MSKYDLEFAAGRYYNSVYLICQDCGWHKTVLEENGRGNLRELKAEHNGNCYPPPSSGWVAPAAFTFDFGLAP